MGFLSWQILTHFSHPRKKYNRSSLLSHENNSRHKKRAPERHVHFYYSNPLEYTIFYISYTYFLCKTKINSLWAKKRKYKVSEYIFYVWPEHIWNKNGLTQTVWVNLHFEARFRALQWKFLGRTPRVLRNQNCQSMGSN